MESETAGSRTDVGGALAVVRERKRRALRQRLSDTATVMFLERGFDNVRVSDVAEACGVSTKTVWNHFSSKEALLFDRGDRLASVLRAAASRPTDVLSDVLRCIREEIDQLDAAGPARTASNESDAIRMVRAFALLTEANAGLRAATADRLEHLIQLAASALAEQNGESAASPRNQVVASALISLWRVHLGALLRYADTQRPLSEVKQHALAEVEAGAELVARLI